MTIPHSSVVINVVGKMKTKGEKRSRTQAEEKMYSALISSVLTLKVERELDIAAQHGNKLAAALHHLLHQLEMCK